MNSTWVDEQKGRFPSSACRQKLANEGVDRPTSATPRSAASKEFHPAAAKSPCLNQAESPEEIESAKDLARSLVRLGLDKVMVAGYVNDAPVELAGCWNPSTTNRWNTGVKERCI